MSAVIFPCDGAAVPHDWRGGDVETVSLHTRGPRRTMNLLIEDLEHAFAGRLDGRAYDLVRIASYVYAADQTVSRGGRADWRLEHWGRDLRLAIPVNAPDVWSSPPVTRALQECVGFLTQDQWRFAFEPARADEDRQLLLPEAGPAGGVSTDVVVPFSGGMDSLATVLAELTEERRPLLVSHQSWGLVEGERRRIAVALRQRFGSDSFSILDAAVHRTGDEARERTRRSRTFLYGALALAAAHRMGAAAVLLSDNGVASLNLPTNRQLVGSRASRSTHPRFIVLLNTLATAVLDQPPEVRNPLWDRTRREVVERIAAAGQPELIGATLSCVNSQRRPRTRPHCGYCSQCIDRRFATAGAGLEEYDLPERYGLDVFLEELPEGDPRTTAVSYVRFARDLHTLSDQGAVEAYPELLDALRKGRETQDLEAYLDMLLRHSETVLTVLSGMVERSAGSLARGDLPQHSLLVMAAAPPTDGPAAPPFSHSKSYESVRLGDAEFTLTPPQAQVVKNLHHAHEAGIHALRTRDALDGVEANATRVSEVFRDSAAWENLVVTEKRGRYRLNFPPKNA